jgi:hypothetical protein
MHIIVMPPHIIIIGMPMFIMAIMRSQHSMNMSFMESSIGIISHFMPVGVMVQVILHIIIAIGIMFGIMPPIIGIMPFIIGIIPFIMGIMPVIIGMGIIVCIGIAAFMSGSEPVLEVIEVSASGVRARTCAINEKAGRNSFSSGRSERTQPITDALHTIAASCLLN